MSTMQVIGLISGIIAVISWTLLTINSIRNKRTEIELLKSDLNDLREAIEKLEKKYNA